MYEYGHISYMIVHVYEYLYYIFTYLCIFMHEKFFTGALLFQVMITVTHYFLKQVTNNSNILKFLLKYVPNFDFINDSVHYAKICRPL